MLAAKELRQKFIKFFESKGHKAIPSASLIPEHDPTVLFTTAGMHPLIPYLMGEKHPAGKRLTNIQKCIRTADIDEIGDNRHLTFFEMMGNWSLGDYFKKEAIEWSWEFLTDPKWLGLDPNRFYITVFKGENNIPRDEEAIKIWQSVLANSQVSNEVAGDDEIVKQGIRIIPLDMAENFWIAGASGPCGGDTEMFYDTRPEEGPLNGKFDDYVNDFRLIEVWNDVFIEFNKKPDGTVEKLEQQNVDTGMGVERAITVLNGYSNVFETELFLPLIEQINFLRGYKVRSANGYDIYAHESDPNYEEIVKSVRIIADHIKAATMILGDDNAVTPSNVDQGYILRRLIRRAVRYGKKLSINEIFTFKISEVIIDMYKDVYPEVKKNQDFIINQLIQEEEKFSKTLEKGEKEFQKMIKNKKLSGKEAFILFSTYGFPLELTKELAKEKNIKIDVDEFNKEMQKHQELSRKGAKQKFKGGLASRDEQTAKLHTATHLLLQALREVLGSHVIQKGSNITADRLRFDFNYDEKLTEEQKQQVENIVNAKISENLPITYEEMPVEEAKEKGAIGAFEDRYGDKVKVYSIGDFSKEICGGPHAENTKELGHFKIKKEESSSAGIRRIKAVLE